MINTAPMINKVSPSGLTPLIAQAAQFRLPAAFTNLVPMRQPNKRSWCSRAAANTGRGSTLTAGDCRDFSSLGST